MIHLRTRSFLILILLLAAASCEDFSELPSRTDLGSWTTYNTSNGLVSENIWCLFADSQGIIWAGTAERGVMKFDGSSWSTISTAHGLIDNMVLSIEEDANGDIWFGTLNGFSIYNGSTFDNYFGTGGEIWTVTALRSDDQGDMWVGTFDDGLFEVRSDGVKSYFSEINSDANYIHSIDVDTLGTIWAGTQGGLYRIRSGRAELLTISDGLSSNTVRAVYCDSWGDVWLGTWYAPFITKYSNGTFSKVSLFNSTLSTAVNAFTEDLQGNVWMGLVADGAVKFDGAVMRSFSVNDGLPGITIIDVAVDPSGNIWLASYEDGIVKYTPSFEKTTP
jgi:ligand-binding sensor domain-containing protein